MKKRGENKMSKVEEKYGKAKKVVGSRFYLKFVSWSNIVLWSCFIFATITVGFNSIGKIMENKGISGVLTIILVLFLLILAQIGFIALGIFLLKKYSNIYFYDDGFVVGSKGEKNYYKDLKYYFTPGLTPGTFTSINYKPGNQDWKMILGNGYGVKSFHLFQEDVVKAVYSEVMENIERGGMEVFPFKNPKKNVLGFFGQRRTLAKMAELIENGYKITVTKEYISFDNEIYKWDDYKVSGNYGNIKVFSLDGKVILSLVNLTVYRPNLLSTLISALNKN